MAQPHVFTEFFTTKAPGKGTGLGLSLAKKIIDEHGGTIEVESSEQGGAKFIVWIPIELEHLNQAMVTR